MYHDIAGCRMAALIRICMPLDKIRTGICILMASGAVFSVLFLKPAVRIVSVVTGMGNGYGDFNGSSSSGLCSDVPSGAVTGSKACKAQQKIPRTTRTAL